MVKDPFIKKSLEVAGENLVLAKLWLMGYVSFLTPRNYPKIDIVAYNPKNNNRVDIQVKTTEENSFTFGKLTEEDLKTKFKEQYVFVHVSKDRKDIKFFIVPSDDIPKLIRQEWDRYVKTAKHRKPIAPFEQQSGIILLEQLKDYENKWKENLKLE